MTAAGVGPAGAPPRRAGRVADGIRAVDGQPAGALLLQDAIRPDAPRMVRALRDAGIRRVVLVTGDRADIADRVGRVVGVDAVLADCDPAEKLAAIGRESANGATIMVGDGVNDAPPSPPPGSGSRSPRAAPQRRPRPPTWCSPSTGSTRWPTRS